MQHWRSPVAQTDGAFAKQRRRRESGPILELCYLAAAVALYRWHNKPSASRSSMDSQVVENTLAMSTLKNAQALLLVSLRSVPQRRGSCLVGIIGIAGVVAVMVIAMSGALQRTVQDAGDPGRAIVPRGGTESEGASTLLRDAVAIVQSAPGTARSGETLLVSAEVLGVFTSSGDAHESELIADSETLLASSQRNVFQSVTVRLESPQSLAVLKDALSTNP
jgi:hypothetical protein